MSNSLLQVGSAQASWNVAGTRILKYSLEMYHNGLKEYKVISASDMDILKNKANLQAQKWNEEWERIDQKRKRNEMKEASVDKALSLTQESEKAITDIENLLKFTLTKDDTIDWEALKRKDEYLEKKPIKPSEKDNLEYPEEPQRDVVKFSFMEKIFKSLKEKRIKENEECFQSKMVEWISEKKEIDIKNANKHKNYIEIIDNWENEVKKWNEMKEKFYFDRNEYNSKIDNMKEKYLSQDVDSIVEYCDMVLNNSMYPDSFPQNFEIEYIKETKIIIVEYQLPSQECFPIAKEVKFIASRNELKESYLSESQQVKMFDDAIYKIALRLIHEIFEADKANAIDAISFNGWVKAINKATGKEENNCILSIQVKKDEFIAIDLANVDPKVCFKSLKGVASSKLSSLTPVQPILQISKVDKRFVESYEVAKNLDDSTNLAAMDWEDFEHLIRELFEKEFSVNGGEVKITQASRDGGVDAVAFDPDPIRGGKIVIQAKRYTNTVGVSAVRDLFGTTVNEGATKGILVSTADYGPDAYEFAKGKPLTLLNGSNLLHLLQKHGYHAKIDIKEAKKILLDQSF